MAFRSLLPSLALLLARCPELRLIRSGVNHHRSKSPGVIARVTFVTRMAPAGEFELSVYQFERNRSRIGRKYMSKFTLSGNRLLGLDAVEWLVWTLVVIGLACAGASVI